MDSHRLAPLVFLALSVALLGNISKARHTEVYDVKPAYRVAARYPVPGSLYVNDRFRYGVPKYLVYPDDYGLESYSAEGEDFSVDETGGLDSRQKRGYKAGEILAMLKEAARARNGNTEGINKSFRYGISKR